MEIEILGTGTSTGVPEIGCQCKVCQSSDPYDKRLRTSALVRVNGVGILIDCGPDFRQQLLRASDKHIDAVLLTHIHYDHVGGIDDLRPYCRKGEMGIFAQQDVNDELKIKLPYCFKDKLYPGVPLLSLHNIQVDVPFSIKGVEILPLRVMHAKLPILGFRIADFAYITDAKTIPKATLKQLYGVKVLIINALRINEHMSHLSLSEALELIRIINPKRAYLTHIAHTMGLHSEVNTLLPDNVELAYDGMVISN